MPKKTITKIKTAITLDKEVMKEINKKMKKMKLKRSTIINDCCRSILLKNPFKSANKLMEEKRDDTSTK